MDTLTSLSFAWTTLHACVVVAVDDRVATAVRAVMSSLHAACSGRRGSPTMAVLRSGALRAWALSFAEGGNGDGARVAAMDSGASDDDGDVRMTAAGAVGGVLGDDDQATAFASNCEWVLQWCDTRHGVLAVVLSAFASYCEALRAYVPDTHTTTGARVECVHVCVCVCVCTLGWVASTHLCPFAMLPVLRMCHCTYTATAVPLRSC